MFLDLFIRDAPASCGKLVVFDEAHKYMDASFVSCLRLMINRHLIDGCRIKELGSHLVSYARQMRHSGVCYSPFHGFGNNDS